MGVRPLRVLAACAVLLAAAPALAQGDQAFERMLRGESAMQGPELERAIEAASVHPLGAQENPVRAQMPPGQHAYLRRLRCADGRAPTFDRIGNFGMGVYGNIIDGYRVVCAGSQPAQSTIFMDMYHRGHVENRPVPGFTITGGAGGATPERVSR